MSKFFFLLGRQVDLSPPPLARPSPFMSLKSTRTRAYYNTLVGLFIDLFSNTRALSGQFPTDASRM